MPASPTSNTTTEPTGTVFTLPAHGAAIEGRAVPLAEAIAAAAAVLRGAAGPLIAGPLIAGPLIAGPLIAGLRTDAAGAVAAAALARRLDGVLDHAESDALLRDLAAMRGAGWSVTTPLAARAEADLFLMVGDGHAEAWPEFATRLGLDRPPTLPGRSGAALPPATAMAPRRVEYLAPGADLTARLGLLRALVKGRRIAAPPELATLAETLRGARYGVAVWSAARLDALGVEMLCGLIDDLNTTTRFAGLPLPAGGNAVGVAQALAAATGFACRIGFRNGVPHHDPWRYDAARLVASGEADAVLWLDALGGGPPPWLGQVGAGQVKLVVLAPPAVAGSGWARLAAAPAVAIAVGRPGIDHAAALYDPAAAALLAVVPAAPAATPTAAALLDRITAALGAC